MQYKHAQCTTASLYHHSGQLQNWRTVWLILRYYPDPNPTHCPNCPNPDLYPNPGNPNPEPLPQAKLPTKHLHLTSTRQPNPRHQQVHIYHNPRHMLRISQTLTQGRIGCQKVLFRPSTLTRAIHQSTPKTNPSPLLSSTPTQYSSMKVASLKDECRRRGLRLGGRKADLIERLASHDFSTVSKRAGNGNPNLGPNPGPNPGNPNLGPNLHRVRLLTTTPPTLAQGDTSTIDFCKLPHTGLPADAPRIKIPTSPDAYGEVARFGTHAITNDRKVAESVAEDELHSKQPQEIHYASGHVVRSFTGDHSSEQSHDELNTNDKLVLSGMAAAVGFWWWLGLEGEK